MSNEHLRTWEQGAFRLELFDTGRTDRLGKCRLAYRLFHRDRLIFEGADFISHHSGS
jgi:hypothetical protein